VARRGFTLVELLVVIAIISVLTGIAIPAVQAAREASRRTSCLNNLGQVAKGMAQHEAQFGHFPTGGWGGVWLGVSPRGSDAAQPGGWTFSLLPFIEELAAHDSLAKNPSTEDYKAFAKAGIAVYNCPTRAGRRVLGNVNTTGYFGAPAGGITIDSAARCDYAANGGSSGACAESETIKRLPVNGLNRDLTFTACQGGGSASLAFKDVASAGAFTAGACGSCEGDIDALLLANASNNYAYCPKDLAEGDLWRKQGMMTTLVRQSVSDPAIVTAAIVANHQNGVAHFMSRVTPAHIRDGLTNTYLVAEKYVAADTYQTGTDKGDDRPMYVGFSPTNIRWGLAPPARDEAGISRPTAFGSAHAGGWNVGLADGSVRTISYDIAPDLHQRLSSRADKQVAIVP